MNSTLAAGAWRRCLIIMVCVLTSSGVVAAEESSAFPLLRDSLDPEFHRILEAQLRAEFKGARQQQVQNKQTSLVVADITDLRHPRVAEVNGEVMLYAASLPKIAILLGAYVQAERGELVMDDELRASLTRMVRNSSNRDATAVLKRIGFGKLAEILQSDRYRLYDPKYGGGLWVGRGYGGLGVWRRDPINNISHGASAMQVARFYYLLLTNQLVNPQSTREMLEILAYPAINHKFVKGLKQINPEAKIVRKSGTWRNFHADSGVVESQHGRYIIVAIGEHPEGGNDLVRFVRAVEETFQIISGGDK